MYDIVVEIKIVRQRDNEDDTVDGPTEHIAHRHGRAIIEIHSFVGGGRSIGYASEGITKQGRLFPLSDFEVRKIPFGSLIP